MMRTEPSRCRKEVAVATLEHGAGDDDRAPGGKCCVADSVQPRPAVFVGQPDTLAHALDIGRAVEGVGLNERGVQHPGQPLCDLGLAGSGDAHHYEEVGYSADRRRLDHG
jgi:hypothetical protein